MFTGLVRGMGSIREAAPFGKGRRFHIAIGPLAETCGIGQSIAINGACLTVTSLDGAVATFDAVAETVARTNLAQLRAGAKVNLEPALKAGDVLDGHIVLGHVDALARVLAIETTGADNRVLKIELPKEIRHLVAEKGSVAVNGISLTVASANYEWFTVAVIPHTWINTTLADLKPGDGVNLEADVMARYVARIMQCRQYAAEAGQAATAANPAAASTIDEDLLRRNGFM